MKMAKTSEAPEVSAPTWAEPATRTSPAHATPSLRALQLPVASSTSRDRSRYAILAEHGRGGLGRVFRARDVELGRDVAIKELIAPSDVSEARFLREALITARLEHPGIVPVHEAGRWSDGTPFYAMKLVAGRPLSDLLGDRTAAEQRMALLHHVIAVADAIAYAHDRGVIHRDLKPSNVIVGEFGETVVIDWGLAKDVASPDGSARGHAAAPVYPGDHRDDELTSAGDVLGTPAYMSPEQQRGEPVDRRTDVFAIGVMLWELCTPHKLPPNYSGQRERILRQAGVDADLAAIIYKALDPDPSLRYLDAGALAADLKAFESGARIGARSYSLFAMLAHWTRRHRAIAASALAVLALATAGTIAYVRSVTAERDRTDAALHGSERERARADEALRAAHRERDRARLSEAAAIMDRDPAQASELLATLPLHSPQYTLLTARASQLAAAHVIAVPGMLDRTYHAPGDESLEVLAGDGRLYELAPSSGALELRASGVTGQLAHQPGGWLYTQRNPATGAIGVAHAGSAQSSTVELPSIVRLVALDDAVYVLDRYEGDLYELAGSGARVFARHVRWVTADGEIMIVCHSDGTLRVWSKRSLVFQGHSAATRTPQPVIARNGWAALTAGGVLAGGRRGQSISIPTLITGDHELALSEDGVVAIADYEPGGTAWYLAADSTRLEHGPRREANLFTVAADGKLAAWGYTDGAVSVLDTVTGTSWQLRGVRGRVSWLFVDAARSRVIAGNRTAIWVWNLPATASLAARMPCRIKHIEPSLDGQLVALDCDDGGVRVWSRATGTVVQAHAHTRYSYGLAWVRDKLCSGGYGDGEVMCSSPDGAQLERAWAGTSRIFLPVANRSLDGVVFASIDGKVSRFDGQLHTLYMHNGGYQTAISGDGSLVGSGSFDGSLAVYDVAADRLVAHVPAHRGSIKTIAWVDSELWTSGNDGELRRWQVDANGVVLRHALQVGAGLDLLQAKHGRWAASIEEHTLVVGRGDAIELRLDLGRKITAIELSPDQRYVAAGIEGEIAVIDLARHALATLTASAPVPNCLSFVTPTELAFSEDFAFKKLDVDQLAYTPFRTDEQSDPAR